MGYPQLQWLIMIPLVDQHVYHPPVNTNFIGVMFYHSQENGWCNYYCFTHIIDHHWGLP